MKDSGNIIVKEKRHSALTLKTKYIGVIIDDKY